MQSGTFGKPSTLRPLFPDEISDETRQKLEGYLAANGALRQVCLSITYTRLRPSGVSGVSVHRDDARESDVDGDTVTATWSVASKHAESTASFNDTNLLDATVIMNTVATTYFA